MARLREEVAAPTAINAAGLNRGRAVRSVASRTEVKLTVSRGTAGLLGGNMAQSPASMAKGEVDGEAVGGSRDPLSYRCNEVRWR